MPAAVDYVLSTRPTFPWSLSHVGMPALVAFAAGLVAITLFTYFRHPQASRKRIFIIVTLRLLALLVALVTAVRPSVGITEDPKVPSQLLIGIDMSESMSVRDEFNNLTRIEAVRKVLERAAPTIEELEREQNVTVTVYGFGPSEFTEACGRYDPLAPAIAKRSDYGAMLNKLHDRWQTERFVRGLYLVGDGADNGSAYNALTEAARMRAAGIAVSTFAVGTQTPPNAARDVGITALAVEPDPVPIKNDVTIRATVHAYGFVGATVPVIVSFDVGQGFEEVRVVQATLTKLTGNEINVTVKAPGNPGEVKVKVEIPVDKVPGDVAPQNNTKITLFTTTKEGVRVLVVDRLRPENTRFLDALRADKRLDIYPAIRQTDEPGGPGEREDFDFETRAYDVIVLGNVSATQLKAIDPKLPEKIRDLVLKKGVGLLLLGGEAGFAGTSGRPLADGWKGSALEALLPVSLSDFPASSNVLANDRALFQTVPTAEGLASYFMKVGDTPQQTKDLWDRLNAPRSFSRMNAISRLGKPLPTATVYAVAADDRDAITAGLRPTDRMPPLIVAHAVGDNQRGRVLAFAGADSYLWEVMGLKEGKQGLLLHHRFWKQVVLWLAHQELDEGNAYARPKFRDLLVKNTQTVRVGLRQPGGADAVEPKFEVKVLAPGEPEAQAKSPPVVPDPEGGARFVYDPPVPGEYVVKLIATGKDGKGNDVKGEAVARFFASPEVSEEMLRTAADYDFLTKLAGAGGGKSLRLEDLPTLLKELKAQPIDTAKPKPRYVPDWRREHSKGFLPGWLTLFVLLLGTEWALRRYWGMV